MAGLIKSIIRIALTLVIIAWFIPTVSVSNWVTLLLAAVVLSLVDSIVKPVLRLIFLPVTIVTFGLFSVVLNVALLWLVTYLVPGFVILPTEILGFALNQFFTLAVIGVIISTTRGLIKLLL